MSIRPSTPYISIWFVRRSTSTRIVDIGKKITTQLRHSLSPFWLDSQSTLLMATNDTSAKRSAWISRRIDVIAEAVQLREIFPHKCGDPDMLAGGDTKYIPTAKYNRINHIKLNLDGDPPNPHKTNSDPPVAALFIAAIDKKSLQKSKQPVPCAVYRAAR